MTIFEQTFRNLMIASNLVDNRVFFWSAPQVPASQAKTPYLVFVEISPVTGEYPQDGPLALQHRDYQVSIFDPSQTRVTAIADSLRQHLDGYRATYQNVRFGAIFFHNQTTLYEPETQLFGIVQEYRTQYHMLLDNPAAFVAPTRSKNPQ